MEKIILGVIKHQINKSNFGDLSDEQYKIILDEIFKIYKDTINENKTKK